MRKVYRCPECGSGLHVSLLGNVATDAFCFTCKKDIPVDEMQIKEVNKPKFIIGERVYHAVPDSEAGVVIDVCYYYLANQYQYQVAFSATATSLWYYEHELSKTKTFT